jgi:hypothetical protein
MAIVSQRHIAANSAVGTSHSFTGIQVDSATDLGLLVCFDSGGTITSPTFNGDPLTYLNGTFNEWWYMTAPDVGTFTLSATTGSSTGVRALIWVLNGVHQATAPRYLAGTNAATITWSWTGLSVGDFIACTASRGGTPTWAAGGGLTEESDGTYSVTPTVTHGVGAGSMFNASGTTETPSFTNTGGNSGTNRFGSAAWVEAGGGGSAIAAISSGYHVRNINR